jgi:uncharacterized membrane protein
VSPVNVTPVTVVKFAKPPVIVLNFAVSPVIKFVVTSELKAPLTN